MSSEEQVMTILTLLATFFGIMMSLSGIPQIIKIFKRKSAKDISQVTYSIIFTGGIVWFLYGMEIQNTPIIISNSIGSLVAFVILLGWFLYGR